MCLVQIMSLFYVLSPAPHYGPKQKINYHSIISANPVFLKDSISLHGKFWKLVGTSFIVPISEEFYWYLM